MKRNLSSKEAEKTSFRKKKKNCIQTQHEQRFRIVNETEIETQHTHNCVSISLTRIPTRVYLLDTSSPYNNCWISYYFFFVSSTKKKGSEVKNETRKVYAFCRNWKTLFCCCCFDDRALKMHILLEERIKKKKASIRRQIDAICWLAADVHDSTIKKLYVLRSRKESTLMRSRHGKLYLILLFAEHKIVKKNKSRIKEAPRGSHITIIINLWILVDGILYFEIFFHFFFLHCARYFAAR